MLNLAQRPHVNPRPVIRLTIALWVVALLVCSASLYLYWDYFTAQGQNVESLMETDAKIEQELIDLEALIARLDEVDLELQEREIAVLNEKIAQRTFSWSSLFDRVAEVLPGAVSVDRLTPSVKLAGTSSASGVGAETPPTIVSLAISGTARNDKALLDLVDRFFEHPSFTKPNLSAETRGDGRELGFSMTVTFLPEVGSMSGQELPAAEIGPGAAGEGSDQLEGDQV
jgi:Tfp pilus assembly protein PilN